MLIEKVLYRAQVKVTAGRHAWAVSSDGLLDLKVSIPRELGGTNGRGAKPEQLFAACYAASFLGMMRLVARREGIALPTGTEVESTVGVGATPQGFEIEIELKIHLPGLPRVEADSLVEKSQAVCPYSNAMGSNVPVRLLLA